MPQSPWDCSPMPRHSITLSSTHPEQGNNCKTLREMSEAVMGIRRYKHKQRTMSISLYRWHNWQEGRCLNLRWEAIAPSSSNLGPLKQRTSSSAHPEQHPGTSGFDFKYIASGSLHLKTDNLKALQTCYCKFNLMKRELPKNTDTFPKKIKKEKPVRRNTPRRWEDHSKKSLE